MFVHCTYTRFSNDRLELGEESTQFSFITRILYKMFMYFRLWIYNQHITESISIKTMQKEEYISNVYSSNVNLYQKSNVNT